MSEIETRINYIRDLLETSPSPENLEWSTSQIRSLLSIISTLEERVRELENKNKGLEMSMPKDPNHSDCIIVLKSGFDAFLHMAKEKVKQAESRIKELEDENKTHLHSIEIWREKYHETFDRIKVLEEAIEKVLTWRNLDGDGISDPLREELYKAQGIYACGFRDSYEKQPPK
jgi:cell fate (sporulation/competence/biofilm development) regulator YmcA (YheA/YmcA/DUF963 family)